jgi:hypothetical protein
MSSVWEIFRRCEAAVLGEVRTHRLQNDKEFHFQNWVYERILEAGYSSSTVGRNTYPDFPISESDESYEVKGITAGSRERDFDSNSALPSGQHSGKKVYYIFGRYENPSQGGGSAFVADNKSMRVLGTFGDILLRDRKMYAPYTPYKLLSGLRGRCTLIARSDAQPPQDLFDEVGRFGRQEAEQILVGYRADLKANTLLGEFEDNPNSGAWHDFVAYRSKEDHDTEPVELIDA